MVRSRYIGSNRPRQAGFSATHKQDFAAHVTGGDWLHWADQILTNDGWGNVQNELNEIQSAISVLPNVVLNFTPSTPGAIPIFADSSGLTLTQASFPITMGAFGDIFFPDFSDGSFNLISVQQTSIPIKAQKLIITAQGNSIGIGGDLYLSGGSGASGNGTVTIGSNQLVFDSSLSNPVFYQLNSESNAVDLTIIAQSTNAPTGTPGNLWLESGVNGNGQAGDIYLYSYPGLIRLLTSGLFFDPNLGPAHISQTAVVSGSAVDFTLSAQSTPTDVGGSVRIQSGTGPIANGSIFLDAWNTGNLNIISPLMQFDVNTVNPRFTQQVRDDSSANDLIISAQDNISGMGGALWLEGGMSFGLNVRNAINLLADTSGVNLLTGSVNFGPNYNPVNGYTNGVSISQTWAVVSAAADMTIAAQSIPSGTGTPGALWLASGYNYETGIGGFVNLYPDSGQVVILSNILAFGARPYNGSFYTPRITQMDYISGLPDNVGAQTFTILAQGNANGIGGNLVLGSGMGYKDGPRGIPGDDGSISLQAGLGQIILAGTSFAGTGAISVYGGLYIGNGAPIGNPIDGIFLFSVGGSLFWRDPSGTDHPL